MGRCGNRAPMPHGANCRPAGILLKEAISGSCTSRKMAQKTTIRKIARFSGCAVALKNSFKIWATRRRRKNARTTSSIAIPTSAAREKKSLCLTCRDTITAPTTLTGIATAAIMINRLSGSSEGRGGAAGVRRRNGTSTEFWLMTNSTMPRTPDASSIFLSGFEVGLHVLVHFRLAPVPSPAAARVQHDIAEWIECESAQSFVTLGIPAVPQVAVPEVKDAPVDKTDLPAHSTMKRFSPAQIMLDLASAHSHGIHTTLEHTHCRTQNRTIRGSENANVVEPMRFQQFAPGSPGKPGGGVSRKRRVGITEVFRLRLAHGDFVANRFADRIARSVDF